MNLREAAKALLDALGCSGVAGVCGEEYEALRDALEAADEYERRNPLGGPATMFDAIANRIRAGEEYHAVLADYGLQELKR